MSESSDSEVQICLDGHIITINLDTSPEGATKFCRDCGAQTIDRCPSCDSPFKRRDLRRKRQYDDRRRELRIRRHDTPRLPPSYCNECSAPFPWTERKLAAITQAVESSELTPEEQQEFQDAAAEVINRTPQAEGAVQKIKKLLTKAGQGLVQATRDILVDVLSEAAKKQLGF